MNPVTVAVPAALMLALAFSSPANGQLPDGQPEADARRFTAIVAKMGAASDAQYDRVSIAVERYSTVESGSTPGEGGVTVEPIAGIGMASGVITVDGLTSRRLLIAQSVAEGAGRRVMLVFAPSLPGAAFAEIFGAILLNVDRRGRGTGELIAGAKLGLDENGVLQVEQRLGPVQLLADVKVRD